MIYFDSRNVVEEGAAKGNGITLGEASSVTRRGQ